MLCPFVWICFGVPGEMEEEVTRVLVIVFPRAFAMHGCTDSKKSIKSPLSTTVHLTVRARPVKEYSL